ncbi:MAG: ABC transporter permease subunit [Actinomycetota bacterium]
MSAPASPTSTPDMRDAPAASDAHAHAHRSDAATTGRATRQAGRSWPVMRAIIAKDLLAVRRSKAVVIPMLAVPALLMIVLPLFVGLGARAAENPDVGRILSSMPGDLARPILDLPQREQLIVLVNGYLLAPLFLIVPLMVSAVLAADAFAGEKERKTLESLLHLPIAERDLFLAKLLTAFIPAIAVSWIGFVCFAVVSNTVAWPILHRIFVPTPLWLVMILWVGPAVAMLGLAVMVRVSARARTSQEANQLGGAVILPLIFLSVGQSSGLLLAPLPVAIAIGGAIWLVALLLVRGGAKRFTRDQLAARV